ncbi:glycoside hydrolase family 127 protein [Arthrobacter sp. 35W]|uniref:glycoside hydrolase family 127 protein n=1 Tax=Arthrobacter sp. 35W TaxID=1132441 RepID=UPI000420972B|nr:beta-L-arabinofuranosidase domain-containing protein [Arthrobacter sp. 35W]
MNSSTAKRQHAPLSALAAANITWDGGFWGDQLERTRTVTVPSMWNSLSDPAVSPGWRNFLIAAGDAQGRHQGPPFLDGDFYKWLEAAISLLETTPDPELAEEINQIAAKIASVQREDGYLHTPTRIAERNSETAQALADRFNFETYNLGHLITAGVRHHRVTGSTVLLDAAERAAGFLEDLATNHTDQLARSAICPSHYMAVIELYRETGNERYLRLAESFVTVRDDFEGGDDNQDRVRVRDQKVAAGHAVRANYLYAGLADIVAETGDDELATVLDRLWKDVVDTKLYITGGCGALYDGASPDGNPMQSDISRVHQAYGRAFQLPNTTAHNESCANIGMIFWSERMLALTGDAAYADVIERIAYNSLLASISLDGTRYFYTNPLRQVRGLPFDLRMPGDTAQRPIPTPPPSDARLRAEYMSCFCCPPNIARTLAQFHERAMSTSDDGLWVHLYGSAQVQVEVDGRGIGLQETSAQPWGENVDFTVTSVADGGLPLKLRIPGWSEGSTIAVNGEQVAVGAPGTYATLDRPWQVGDTISLVLPMPVRMVRGHRLAEEISNQVAVTRGPVVYCVESQDLPDGVRMEQVALRRGTTFTPVERDVEGRPMVVLECEAVILPQVQEQGLYAEVDDAELRTAPVRLIPYFAWGNRGPSEMSVWLPLAW